MKSEPLADFKVIHLAAHGVSDEIEPDRAALVLAPGSESEDGVWQAREYMTRTGHAAGVHKPTRRSIPAPIPRICRTTVGSGGEASTPAIPK